MNSISAKIDTIKNETKVLQLCIGFCKIIQKKSGHSFPLSLSYLIALFYFVNKTIKIGKLQFASKYASFTTLSTSIVIKDFIFRIGIKIGTVSITLFLKQNKFSTTLNDKKQIQTISGQQWKHNYTINKSHQYYKPNQYRLIVVINRETNCDCVNSSKGIKIFILNYITKFNCCWYAATRYLERKHDQALYNQNGNGLINIELPENIQIQQQEMYIIINEQDQDKISICNQNEYSSAFATNFEARICCWELNK